MFTNGQNGASAATPDFAPPKLDISKAGSATDVRLSGNWTTSTVGTVDEAVRSLERESGGTLRLDLSGVERNATHRPILTQRKVRRQFRDRRRFPYTCRPDERHHHRSGLRCKVNFTDRREHV